jgi:hypothetical protein
MGDRRLRAFALAQSTAIEAQQTIISSHAYMLKLEYDESIPAYNIDIYRYNTAGRKRNVYVSAPVCTDKSFTRHKLFSDLIAGMNIPEQTYILELCDTNTNDISIYFRYDGECFAISEDEENDDYHNLTMNITLHTSSFHVLRAMHDENPFNINRPMYYDELLNY